jgi:Protein of unknown function (DUF2971)
MACPRLYKFRSPSLQSIEMLVAGKLWMAAVDTLNDPMDGRRTIDTRMTYKEYRSHFRDFTRRMYSRPFGRHSSEGTYQAEVDREFAGLSTMFSIGVCSFSSSPDNELLWAHYAAGHTGFAIEFDTSRPISEPGLVLREVTYCRDFTHPRLLDLLKRGPDAEREHATIKSESWRYEAEWRLLCDRPNVAIPSPWPIVGIIFGQNMPATTRELIRSTASSSARLMQAARAPSSYRMRFEALGDA